MNSRPHLLLAAFLLTPSLWGEGTWTLQTSGVTQMLRSISCPTPNNCQVVGELGTYLRMTNGDGVWRRDSTTFASDAGLETIAFADSLNGWVLVSNSKNIFGTSNKGLTWNSFTASGQIGINPGVTALYAGQGEVYYAGNWVECGGGGSNCNPYSGIFNIGGAKLATIPGSAVVTTLCFGNGSAGHLIKYDTIIYNKISESSWGIQWRVPVRLRSLYFSDANTGYSVGDGGKIYKTTNGGEAWVPQTSGTTLSLASVKFADANSGYVVGDGGIILSTTNGGSTWTSMVSPTTRHLNNVVLVGDGSTGYAVGFGGAILKLTGGAASAIHTARSIDPRAGYRRIGNRWYGFSMPDGRAFDAQGRQAP